MPDPDGRTLIVMRGAVAGQWVSLAYLSGGALVPWLAGLLDAGEGGDDPRFAALVAAASELPPGADGLLFVPHLDGRLLPSDPTMRGAWVGLHREHGRAHLVRAVLESVAYEYAGYLRAVRELQPGFAPAGGRVVGGGARSSAWNAIKASVLGVELERLDREELSCWGAALVAGHAVGLVDDLAAAAERATGVAERHAPDPAAHDAYAALESVYRDALAMAVRRGPAAVRARRRPQGGDRVSGLDVLIVGAGRAGGVHAVNLAESTRRARVVGVGGRRAGRRPRPRGAGRRALERPVAGGGARRRRRLRRRGRRHADLPASRHRGDRRAGGQARLLREADGARRRGVPRDVRGGGDAGVTLQIGFMRRFQPEFAEARRRIAAGDIGAPMVIKSLTRGPGLPPRWAWDLQRSNGMLAEVTSHDFDSVRWLAGSDLERVYAEISNRKGAGRGVDHPDFYDNAVVTLRFAYDAIGTIDGTCPADYGYDARAEVLGTEGLLRDRRRARDAAAGGQGPRPRRAPAGASHLARALRRRLPRRDARVRRRRR